MEVAIFDGKKEIIGTPGGSACPEPGEEAIHGDIGDAGYADEVGWG